MRHILFVIKIFLKRLYPGKNRRVFIVDTENIGRYDFISKGKLNCRDTIVLFMSKNAQPLKYEYFKDMAESGARLKLEYVDVGGKNALDHQIGIYLTIASLADSKSKYYIVSNDKGFQFPVKYLASKIPVNVKLLAQKATNESSTSNLIPKIDSNNVVEKKKQNKKSKPKKKCKIVISKNETRILEEIKKVFVDKHSTVYPNILNILKTNSDLKDVHNALIKKYNEKGLQLYKQIKPFIK